MLAALLALAGEGRADGAVSFRDEIAPLLRSRCAICHLTGQEAGNIALHPRVAHASLVGVPASGLPAMARVQPGDSERSYLIHKLQGTHLRAGGSGQRMPLGMAPLEEATIERIRRWIDEGAKDN